LALKVTALALDIDEKDARYFCIIYWHWRLGLALGLGFLLLKPLLESILCSSCFVVQQLLNSTVTDPVCYWWWYVDDY